MAYKKAPFFTETMKLLDGVFSYSDRRFNYFIKNSFQSIFDYLQIDTFFLLSSNLVNNKELKGQEKILDICKLLGSTEYYNAIGGQALYDRLYFANEGIRLGFIDPILEPYPQLSKEFYPGLSIIDVLMMNSRDQVKMLLGKYNIIGKHE